MSVVTCHELSVVGERWTYASEGLQLRMEVVQMRVVLTLEAALEGVGSGRGALARSGPPVHLVSSARREEKRTT